MHTCPQTKQVLAFVSSPAEHFDICCTLPVACGSVEDNGLGPKGGVALAEGAEGEHYSQVAEVRCSPSARLCPAPRVMAH